MCVYIYIYIYICMYVYIYTYMCIYITCAGRARAGRGDKTSFWWLLDG